MLNEQGLFVHLNDLSSKNVLGEGGETRPHLRQDWKVSCQRAFESSVFLLFFFFSVIISKSMTTSGLKEQKDTSKSTDAQATLVCMDSFS